MNACKKHFFYPMNNVIQDYAWGSYTSIEALFDIKNTTEKPQAELWMGAHPNGCSVVTINGNSVLLSDLINEDKDAFLSSPTAQSFGELPYLFKVLAAEKALSIQVHPNKQQAIEGYNKEEKAGIAINAFNRNYKDSNHKPELVYALTTYKAMNGFREFDDIISLFSSMSLPSINSLVTDFSQDPSSNGLKAFFNALLSLESEAKDTALTELVNFASQSTDELFIQIQDLIEQYPNDIGLFTPLMLNVITLQPGEAMYLKACTPHAYINGTGLEIMANSDNVLRAGLTPKYMDIDELMACTEFNSIPQSALLMEPIHIDGGMNYPIPVDDFKFSVLTPHTELPLTTQSAEILFAIDQDMIVNHTSGESVSVPKGHSIFIPAYTEQYTLQSQGKVARAFN
ncbi:mannose-6-phosphate isomerase, class I [Aliivibrio sifiae]|uniref:mannose-6-phosphate isomerase n=1 Tax=Aliivibrio sifiae TaxID=566293 RepID=A0A2S7X871_9GAMM|nr:mannose-6-phosphate isomerase, class I [Aliivibrio sifiae]PQJ87563.1 mannose-6-phosphate isomerase, class I [Aliivibrio sifiae]GLR73166.1 mannose-6-phosphate isomerase [Aliivibrio sifiae]